MQEFIVAIIVAIAGLAVIRRYAPQSLRRMFNATIAQLASRFGWRKVADKFHADAAVAASCGTGCGPCGGCGSADKAAEPVQFSMTPEALKRTIPH